MLGRKGSFSETRTYKPIEMIKRSTLFFGNDVYNTISAFHITFLRMILLMMIVVCLNGTFSVEQPNNSFFEYYPRWRSFMMQLVEQHGPGSVPGLTPTTFPPLVPMSCFWAKMLCCL